MNIIELSKEAGFEVVDGELRLYFDGSKAILKPNLMGTVTDGLKALAALVAANERKVCAAICDRFAERDMHPAECAAAIRARSRK